MNESKGLIPLERVQRGILILRDQKVMLDVDLAELYGVETRTLNQAVKRHTERFPPTFMFQLTEQEKKEVVTNCDHLRKIKYFPSPPYAFTEHGAIMLAAVLNSPIAVNASIRVVEAFVRLRQLLTTNSELGKRLDALEKKYDTRFKMVFEAIRQLMTPEEKPKKKIGF
ncbi:MAG TPA: ORF6N domain-containing protein [Kiritimatiellia bacterium]